jgi:adenylosuccinate synthase
MGSTAKGVGQAMVDRILRDPDSKAVAKLGFKGGPLEKYVVDRFKYIDELSTCQGILVEGAQGFGLSIYHGDWPFVTSRDVTPWQIAADCGLPFAWAPDIRVFMVYRTYPIRVNNRDGTSGPAYPGQRETTWEAIGVEPEKTTVTKLVRRVFEFSEEQIQHAHWHCAGAAGKTINVLTFADYCNMDQLNNIVNKIPGGVQFMCFGPDDKDMKALVELHYER